MSVKLYNKTKLPEEPLKSLLREAKKLARATGGVVTKITNGSQRSNTSSGVAQRMNLVYDWHLRNKSKNKDGKRKKNLIRTRGGMITVAPPVSYFRRMKKRIEQRPDWYTPEEILKQARFAALCTFRTMIHEYAHIWQFQNPYEVHQTTREGKLRRKDWQYRDEEVHAQEVVTEAMIKLDKQPERKARIDALLEDLAQQFVALSKGEIP